MKLPQGLTASQLEDLARWKDTDTDTILKAIGDDVQYGQSLFWEDLTDEQRKEFTELTYDGVSNLEDLEIACYYTWRDIVFPSVILIMMGDAIFDYHTFVAEKGDTALVGIILSPDGEQYLISLQS